MNGNVYVGITTDSVESRKRDHLERVVRGEVGKFHEAIETYSPSAFTWTQIDTASNVDELAKKEKEYVLKYNSKEEGYNSDSGGGIKKTVYQYDVEGRYVDKYNCLQNAGNVVNASKQSISSACLSVNKLYRGFYWSYDDTFEPARDLRRKEVIQFDLDDNILDVYESVAEASRSSGLSRTCIARVCRGERSSSGGFIWEYN